MNLYTGIVADRDSEVERIDGISDARNGWRSEMIDGMRRGKEKKPMKGKR